MSDWATAEMTLDNYTSTVDNQAATGDHTTTADGMCSVATSFKVTTCYRVV